MTIEEIRKKAEPVFKTHHVSRASLFGSVARNTSNETSDIDLLICFSQPIGLVGYSRLVNDLSFTLGHEVDVVTESSLNPHLRPYVMKDARVIYED